MKILHTRMNRKQRWQEILSVVILVIAMMGGFFFDEAVAALQTLSLSNTVSLPVDI